MIRTTFLAWGFFLLAVPAICSSQPRLIFKSGFERETQIVPSGIAHAFSGQDATTGADWTRDLAALNPSFVYLTGEKPPLDFVATDVRPVPGRDGQPTQALYMAVMGNAAPGPGLVTRNEFSLFPVPEAPLTEGYVSYWLFIQPDYRDHLPKTAASKDLPYYPLDSWRMLMELKEPHSGQVAEKSAAGGKGGTNNYRMSFYIVRDPVTDRLYWRLRGEVVQPNRSLDWDRENRDVPVPLGQWFRVEVYFRQHATDGRVWWAVNGSTIADYRGRTQHPQNPLPMKFWSIFKIYHSPERLASGRSWQLVDDLELWTTFPPGHPAANR